MKPVVILVRSQMGENIGAVARAMSNFGLSELRVVAPRGGWPNEKAREVASGAVNIIDRAQFHKDTASAMSDIQIAFATSARPRDMEKRVLPPHEAMAELAAFAGKGMRTAIMFGPERTGLENDDIALCDTLITIPTAPENASLNLGQSAVVTLYEWLRAQSDAPTVMRELPDIAASEDYQGLFSQLEPYLDEADFFRVPHKKPIMWQNLRNTLLRARMSTQEIRTFRGMLRVLWEGRMPRRK